jgi:hypothetical protein
MSGQVTFKFNIFTAIVLVAALVAIGYFIRKNYVNNKEIRELEKTTKVRENTINGLVKLNDLRGDTIVLLRKTINKTNLVINGYKSSITHLNEELEGLRQSNALIPIDVKFDALVERTGTDSLKKVYGFSGRQIGVLYDDNQELLIRKDEIEKYKSMTDALNYNLGLAQDETRIVTNQFNTCTSQTDEYKKIIQTKDQEVKLLKKQKKGRLWYSIISTAVAVTTTILLIGK